MTDDHLRKLAEAADSEWHEGQWYTSGSGELLDLSPAERRHIAAWSPRAALRLLDERDRLRTELEHLVSQAGPDSCAEQARRHLAERDRLRAERDELRRRLTDEIACDDNRQALGMRADEVVDD